MGQRRRRTLQMSWNAAAVGDVTTPMRFGYAGSGFFRAGSKSPSFESFSFSCSKARFREPRPSGWRSERYIWYWPPAS